MNILVFIEQRDGTIKKSSFEAVKVASEIASETGGSVTAVVAGSHVRNIQNLGGYGASKVLHVADALVDQYSSTAYSKLVHDAVMKSQAHVVFLSATSAGKDLAPRLAVKCDGAVAMDVTSLHVDGGALIATRPIFAGKALETLTLQTDVQIFTLRPNVFSAGTPTESMCPVEALSIEFSESDFSVKTTGTSISSEKIDVAEASMIVSGGRGLQGPEHWYLVEDLASVLGAATGASRAVVDAGWRPHPEQVGQTGKTVSPTLYIACGISGAVQHLAGMSSSKVIVAVNKDKDAPIFQIADYGIVGDAFEVLPVLTDTLKQFLGK